jgi:hypothetical protein
MLFNLSTIIQNSHLHRIDGYGEHEESLSLLSQRQTKLDIFFR